MANRMFSEFQYSLEKAVVHLYGDVTFAAAGAPTLVTGKNKGIKTIVRNSAGDYTITLQDPYQRLLNMDLVFIKATAPSAPAAFISALAVSTVAAPTIRVVFNAAGTATDPASGEEVLLSFELSNSVAV
jgi:hypothetical protein